MDRWTHTTSESACKTVLMNCGAGLGVLAAWVSFMEEEVAFPKWLTRHRKPAISLEGCPVPLHLLCTCHSCICHWRSTRKKPLISQLTKDFRKEDDKDTGWWGYCFEGWVADAQLPFWNRVSCVCKPRLAWHSRFLLLIILGLQARTTMSSLRHNKTGNILGVYLEIRFCAEFITLSKRLGAV